jgi:hypothetical protein
MNVKLFTWSFHDTRMHNIDNVKTQISTYTHLGIFQVHLTWQLNWMVGVVHTWSIGFTYNINDDNITSLLLWNERMTPIWICSIRKSNECGLDPMKGIHKISNPTSFGSSKLIDTNMQIMKIESIICLSVPQSLHEH